MLIQILFALLLGIFAGTVTGLIPGIHINLIGTILVSISLGILSSINPIILIIFITSMAITHTFLDFIPSIFLGCPDTDTELSLLPGHALLMEGKGYEAILLTAYGSMSAIILTVILAYPAIKIIPKIFELTKNIIPYILIFSFLFLLYSERRKFQAVIVFLLTGFLGIITFNLGELNYLPEPLLPLLSGLFGSSMLIKSIQNKTQIGKQIIKKPKINIFRPVLGAVIASPLCSFLPGLGSGQAAVIGNSISKVNEKDFLVLIGATNTFVMGFSFISLYAISKTRTGAAFAIKGILPNLTPQIILILILAMFISGIISFFLTIFLAKYFSQKIHKFNYFILTSITLIVLIFIVFLISGLLGLLIFLISTLTGIFCLDLGVRKTNMMGCIMLPVIIFYLF